MTPVARRNPAAAPQRAKPEALPDVSWPVHATRSAGSEAGLRATVQNFPWSSAFPPASPRPDRPRRKPSPRRRVSSRALSIARWEHSSAIAGLGTHPDLVPRVHRYYADVRLPSSVHVGLAATGLPRPSRRRRAGRNAGYCWDLPVLVQGASTHAQGLRLRGADVAARASAAHPVAFPSTIRGRRPGGGDFGAQWLACVFPCQRLGAVRQ